MARTAAAISRGCPVYYRACVADCLFCSIADGTVPAHVVLSDDVAVAFLDARPVFKGHVLVAPRAHYVTLADLPADLVGPLFLRVQRGSAAIPAAPGAQGRFARRHNTARHSAPPRLGSLVRR